MPQTALFAGAALVTCVCMVVLISTFRGSPKKDAPRIVTVGIPILGNIRAFLAGPLHLIANCYEQ